METMLMEETSAAWARIVDELHTRLSPQSSRAEPRRRVRAYLDGLASSVERKNGWQLAEHAGELTPTGDATAAGGGGMERGCGAR